MDPRRTPETVLGGQSAESGRDIVNRCVAVLDGASAGASGDGTLAMPTSGLNWSPATTATVADRTVSIVEQGTTRSGPVVAGSLLRLELAAALDDVAGAGSVAIQCGDSMLVVALDLTD
jgi:hypothetical protein